MFVLKGRPPLHAGRAGRPLPFHLAAQRTEEPRPGPCRGRPGEEAAPGLGGSCRVSTAAQMRRSPGRAPRGSGGRLWLFSASRGRHLKPGLGPRAPRDLGEAGPGSPPPARATRREAGEECRSRAWPALLRRSSPRPRAPWEVKAGHPPLGREIGERPEFPGSHSTDVQRPEHSE